MLGPQDVGRRVVVRRFVRKSPDGRPLFSDLIGELVEFGDERLVLRDRHGVRHEVRLADIAAGKTVPPPPATNRRTAS